MLQKNNKSNRQKINPNLLIIAVVILLASFVWLFTQLYTQNQINKREQKRLDLEYWQNGGYDGVNKVTPNATSNQKQDDCSSKATKAIPQELAGLTNPTKDQKLQIQQAYLKAYYDCL